MYINIIYILSFFEPITPFIYILYYVWLAWNHQSGATVPVPESTRILTQASITTPKSSANHHEYLVQIYHRLV